MSDKVPNIVAIHYCVLYLEFRRETHWSEVMWFPGRAGQNERASECVHDTVHVKGIPGEHVYFVVTVSMMLRESRW